MVYLNVNDTSSMYTFKNLWNQPFGQSFGTWLDYIIF